MLKPSLHPFCEVQEDQEVQKTIKKLSSLKSGRKGRERIDYSRGTTLFVFYLSQKRSRCTGVALNYNFVERAKKTTRLWFRRCMGTIHPSYLSLRIERVRLSWEGRSRGGSEAAHPSDLAPVIGSLLAAILVLFRSTRVRLYAVVSVNNSIRWKKCQLFMAHGDRTEHG